MFEVTQLAQGAMQQTDESCPVVGSAPQTPRSGVCPSSKQVLALIWLWHIRGYAWGT